MISLEKIPFGGRCDFEGGWCGWQNSGKAIMLWERNSGPTPTEKTGPDFDHTFHNSVNGSSNGHYMFVNMNQHANDAEMKKLVGFASNAVMNSVVFNPPPSVHYNYSSPYRNSCMVIFNSLTCTTHLKTFITTLSGSFLCPSIWTECG